MYISIIRFVDKHQEAAGKLMVFIMNTETDRDRNTNVLTKKAMSCFRQINTGLYLFMNDKKVHNSAKSHC